MDAMRAEAAELMADRIDCTAETSAEAIFEPMEAKAFPSLWSSEAPLEASLAAALAFAMDMERRCMDFEKAARRPSSAARAAFFSVCVMSCDLLPPFALARAALKSLALPRI